MLGALLVWAAARLTFRLTIADFLPPQPAREDQLPSQLLLELSGGSRVAIVLESDTAIATRDVERVFGYLVPKLSAVRGVREVDARLDTGVQHFVARQLPPRIALYVEPAAFAAASHRLSPAGIAEALRDTSPPPAFALPGERARREKDPLGLVRLAAGPMRGWQGTSRVRLIDGFYALPGARTFLLSIEVEAALDDIVAARSLIRSIDGVLAGATRDRAIGPLLRNRRLYQVGRPVSYVSAVEILSADGVRVVLAASVIAFISIGLFFRRVTAPLMIAVTVAFGLAATGAVALLVFGSISLVAWVFIGLLVGLGVDYGIHITVHYWVYGRVGSGRVNAVSSALERPGAAITLGSLTSAGAFLSLLAIPYPWMRQLAVLTAVGLLAILVASFTVLPLLLSFTEPSTRGEPTWWSWVGLVERATSGPLWLGVAPWLALVIGSLAVLPRLRFEPHPWKLAVRGNPESARLERLSREAGSSFTPLLMLSKGTTAEEALGRDREAVRRLRAVAHRAGVATIQSLARWLPAPEDQRANIQLIRANKELFSPARFRRDFETTVADLAKGDPYLTREYLPQVMRSLDPDLGELTLGDLTGLGLGKQVKRHLVRWGDEYIAISYVFLRRFPWAEGAVSTFVDVTNLAGLNDMPGVTLAGDALRSAGHARVIRRAVVLATLIALVLVAIILEARFRRVSLVGLCLAPLVCGLSAALLLMHLLGVELNLLSIALAPIIVGIGVDDGIHIVDRLSSGEDVTTVLREAGSSITMTTLTTVGAFACLVLVTFTGVRELGVVGAGALVVCLLASLHLVPVGWRVLSGRSGSQRTSAR